MMIHERRNAGVFAAFVFFALGAACVARADAPAPFDITPFALPNTPANEIRFEEQRDVVAVEVEYAGPSEIEPKLLYLKKTWPEARIESIPPDDSFSLGWLGHDDWFNPEWKPAASVVTRKGPNAWRIEFAGLTAENPKVTDYDVHFRRTLGLKIEGPDAPALRAVRVYTASASVTEEIRVEMDGEKAATKPIQLTAYNAVIDAVDGKAVQAGGEVSIDSAAISGHPIVIRVTHMKVGRAHSGDDGLITFHRDDDAYTISLTSLAEQGPIWSPESGLYVASAADATSLAAYREAHKGEKNVAQMVAEHAEQSYAGALNGQPRTHPAGFPFGCAYARERFLVEPNGDLVLRKHDATWIPGKDSARYKASGGARFYFGLETATIYARFGDPENALIYTIQGRRGPLLIEQQTFAAPLLVAADSAAWASDDPMVALMRFRFTNTGTETTHVELPLSYAQDSARGNDAPFRAGNEDNFGVMRNACDALSVEGGAVQSPFEGKPVLRAVAKTAMAVAANADATRATWHEELKPGASCEIVLKIPFIALDSKDELAALDKLDFDACLDATKRYWRKALKEGATVHAPEPELSALYASHLAHVRLADTLMPDGSGLINTSVGTSTYGNFCNESCMIIHELDERGLHDEAQRRLDIWIKYQGTVKQPGNFTDYKGMYYGAAGYEQGSYNQHHGWVLWAMAEHYLLSGDEAWFAKNAESIIAGADWVFRQRKNTIAALPHSRGWEAGLLPAGSLEDVTDFYYWLSTNSLTWRGVDRVAQALEAAKHPQAARVRAEADAYRAAIVKAWETNRQHAPLVKLRDGRWVPDYPSRMYLRGRDVGWIREVLEGSVYLLITDLYDTKGPQAQWILDDFQDNRYPRPPYGYPIVNPERTWFDWTGFSMQPNLLGGLMPYLERDEIEMYLWMFYNAWNACYREELTGMVEHAAPFLGFSNRVTIKTSDEANAVSWLRYMFVYTHGDTLYLGRAMPRAWFAQGEPFDANDVATCFGPVSVRYAPNPEARSVHAEAALKLRREPGHVLMRFRLPDKAALKTVNVNGAAWTKFDAQTGDVDISGLSGNIAVDVSY